MMAGAPDSHERPDSDLRGFVVCTAAGCQCRFMSGRAATYKTLVIHVCDVNFNVRKLLSVSNNHLDLLLCRDVGDRDPFQMYALRTLHECHTQHDALVVHVSFVGQVELNSVRWARRCLNATPPGILKRKELSRSGAVRKVLSDWKALEQILSQRNPFLSPSLAVFQSLRLLFC